jgi:hypothetical protein
MCERIHGDGHRLYQHDVTSDWAVQYPDGRVEYFRAANPPAPAWIENSAARSVALAEHERAYYAHRAAAITAYEQAIGAT